MVSTWKKSVATTPEAWARRNARQVGPLRRGAGPRPWSFKTLAMVLAPRRTASDLAPKNFHFMAQGEELGFLGSLAAKEKEEQLEDLSQIGRAEEHTSELQS